MKTLLSIFSCLILVGCGSTPKAPEPTQVIKFKYVMYSIPNELLSIPSQVTRLDPLKATDKDVSLWILDSEKRSIEMEKKLKTIKRLQEKQKADLKNLRQEDVEFH
jgi:uncharacterized protein YcfL